MDPYLITMTLNVDANLLKNLGSNRNVEIAYDDLLNQLGNSDVLSITQLKQLEKYQVEKDKILEELKQHKTIDDAKFLKPLEKLLLAINQAMQETHDKKEKLLHIAHKRYVKETRVWLYFSILTVSFGFLMILAGIILATILKDPIITITTVLAGLVINITSVLFFRQNNYSATQADKKYRDLADLEDIHLSSQLLLSLADINELAANNSN